MQLEDDSLEYEFSLTPNRLSGWEAYVTSFRGSARGWDDELDQDREVGQIRGQRVELAAARTDGVDRAELLESISPEIADFAVAMLDREGRCPLLISTQGLESVAGQCDCLLYVESIEVEADLRGQQVGTGLLRRCAEVLEIYHCLIGLKAFPISNTIGSGRSEEEIVRVKHFYERLGFAHGGGEFMVKNAATCKSAVRPRSD